MLSILKKKSAVKPEPEEEVVEVAEEEAEAEPEVEEEAEPEEEEAPPKKKNGVVTLVKSAAPKGSPAPAAKGSILKAAKGVLLRGSKAQEARKKDELKSELAAKTNQYRFRMDVDEECQITFLDGELDDGIFTNPCAYEHFIQIAGKPRDFICLQEQGPCPICEGSAKNSFMTYFTIIDHRKIKSKKDAKIVYIDQKRVFPAKKGTVKLLTKLALKRGGTLRGIKFDVSRSGSKAPSLGDNFDFVEKVSDATLTKLYGKREKQVGDKKIIVDDSKPYDYDEMIAGMYLEEKQLRNMGFGAQMTVGAEHGASDEEEDVEDHEKDL